MSCRCHQQGTACQQQIGVSPVWRPHCSTTLPCTKTSMTSANKRTHSQRGGHRCLTGGVEAEASLPPENAGRLSNRNGTQVLCSASESLYLMSWGRTIDAADFRALPGKVWHFDIEARRARQPAIDKAAAIGEHSCYSTSRSRKCPGRNIRAVLIRPAPMFGGKLAVFPAGTKPEAAASPNDLRDLFHEV